MYLSRFSMACSSPVWILGPQKTPNPDPAPGGIHESVNQVFRDLAFGKKHLKDLMPEDLF